MRFAYNMQQEFVQRASRMFVENRYRDLDLRRDEAMCADELITSNPEDMFERER